MAIDRKNSEGYDDPTAYEALSNIEREVRQHYGYRPLVFICSPLAGAVRQNLENARKYSAFAVQTGAIPFAPHLLFPQFMDDSNRAERNLGIFFGLVIMSKCDAIWVFGREWSKGMKLEIAKADARRLPIRFFDEDCNEISDNDQSK